MKKYLPTLLALCLVLVFCSTGEEGLAGSGEAGLATAEFSELGYTAVLDLAKAENKHVLIDFFSPT